MYRYLAFYRKDRLSRFRFSLKTFTEEQENGVDPPIE